MSNGNGNTNPTVAMTAGEFALSNSRKSSSSTKVAIVDEMECEPADSVEYAVENFNYQVFSETTDNIPPLSSKTDGSYKSKLRVVARKWITRARGLNWRQKGRQWWTRSSWTNVALVLLSFAFLLILLIVIGEEWRMLRNERWKRQHQCLSAQCLRAAGLFHSKRNVTVSPCENFYQYACGSHFRPHHSSNTPDTPNAQGGEMYRAKFSRDITMSLNRGRPGSVKRVHRPAIDHLTELNVHAIIQALEHILYDWSYTRSSAKYKIAQWFRSCRSRTLRDWMGVRTFLRKAIPTIGGVWLLDNQASNETGAGGENSTAGWPDKLFASPSITNALSMASNWSFMAAIKRLNSDMHVPVFVDFWIVEREDALPKIQFEPDQAAWTGGWRFKYMKEHISKIFQLLAHEARIPYGDPELASRIKVAVDDIELVTGHLHKKLKSSYGKLTSVTLNELNERASGFDWKGLLSTYFNQVDVTFHDNYLVYSRYIPYLKQVPLFLDELKRNYTLPVVNRILNNYMLWNMFESYAWHLSYEFTSLHNMRSYDLDSDIDVDCFTMLHEMFGTVLGAIFVEHHYNLESFNHTMKMLDYLKQSAIDQIEQTKWMDSDTKQRVEKRITDMTFKHRVPAIMENDAKLNYAYRRLKVTHVYVENLFSLVQYHRNVYNRLLGGVAEPSETDWFKRNVNVYDTKIGLVMKHDELFIPIGSLQPPVYHHTLPSVLNFAGLGSMVGTAISHLLGEIGSFKMKKGLAPVWSDKSWDQYLDHWSCMEKRMSNATIERYNLTDWISTHIRHELEETVYELIDDATGLAVAKRAWDRWQTEQENGVENSTLPGGYVDREEVFFTAYAQTFCEKLEWYDVLFGIFMGKNKIPVEINVNQIMSEVPQFAAAFKCPVGSKMNPESRCSVVL